MKKRMTSLLLALALCLGLTVPALAAEASLRCTDSAANGVVRLDAAAPRLYFEVTKAEGAVVEGILLYFYDAGGTLVSASQSGEASEGWKAKTTTQFYVDLTDQMTDEFAYDTVYSCVGTVTIDGTTYTAPTVKFRVDSGTTYDVIVYADLASMEYLGTYAQTNGKPWNLPQPPARSGKTFAGWKVAGGDLIGANDVVALDGDATVFGVWENAQTSTPATPSGGSAFSDVAAGAWYASAVQWAVDQGITAGTGANTFSPNRQCTRGEIITFLWRAAGSPEAENLYGIWDVTAEQYCFEATQWAAEQDMIEHFGNFAPGDPCTRLMAVDFMWKYAGSPSAAPAGFTDVNADAVDWAVETGVTTGTSATTFAPGSTCTRAEIVTFLYRAFAG